MNDDPNDERDRTERAPDEWLLPAPPEMPPALADDPGPRISRAWKAAVLLAAGLIVGGGAVVTAQAIGGDEAQRPSTVSDGGLPGPPADTGDDEGDRAGVHQGDDEGDDEGKQGDEHDSGDRA